MYTYTTFEFARSSPAFPTVIHCDLRVQGGKRGTCQPCRYAACLRVGLKPTDEQKRTRGVSESSDVVISSPEPEEMIIFEQKHICVSMTHRISFR